MDCKSASGRNTIVAPLASENETLSVAARSDDAHIRDARPL